MLPWLDGLRGKPGTLRRTLRRRLYASPRTRQGLIDDFHRLYYNSWHLLDEDTHELRWLGHKLLRCPLDLWTYQEILAETRPELTIETGTYHGGSALFFASILELLGVGLRPRAGRSGCVRHPEHRQRYRRPE